MVWKLMYKKKASNLLEHRMKSWPVLIYLPAGYLDSKTFYSFFFSFSQLKEYQRFSAQLS